MNKNLQWFRLYHRVIDDEKIRLLAFEDRWHFIAVCCLKADGLLDEPESDLKWRKVAVKLGVQLRELDEIKRRLLEVGLVDAEMQPTAWDELQYRSDTSTERVRKFREKSKVKVAETLDETPRNVSVAAQDTETESDTETSSLRSDERARKRGSNPIVVLHAVVDPVSAQKWSQHCEDKGRRLSSAQADELVTVLQAVKAQGGNPAEALRIAIRKGWVTFELEWLRNAGLKMAGAPAEKPVDYLAWCTAFFKSGTWGHIGPKPDEPGCKAPPEIIEQARRAAERQSA